VPALHTSDESPWAGCAVPVHEKPIEAPAQPTMLESAVQPAATDVVSTQQYRVAPLLSVPTLQLRAVSLWSGLSVPEQEYPTEAPTHPMTLETCEQLAGTVSGGAGVPLPFTVALAVQPDIAVMIRRSDDLRRDPFDTMPME
jgi:hypothetical protein